MTFIFAYLWSFQPSPAPSTSAHLRTFCHSYLQYLRWARDFRDVKMLQKVFWLVWIALAWALSSPQHLCSPQDFFLPPTLHLLTTNANTPSSPTAVCCFVSWDSSCCTPSCWLLSSPTARVWTNRNCCLQVTTNHSELTRNNFVIILNNIYSDLR